MMRRGILAALIMAGGLTQATLQADVKLPAIISDNMAVQAGKDLPIWGTADAGEKVSVTLGNQKIDATAGRDGKWMVRLKPVAAGDLGTMTVAGKNTLSVKNIIAGSVWVCSGQSNMEFVLRNAHNAQSEIPKAKYPKIRLFTVRKRVAFVPQTDCSGQWVECTPESAASFSAVGYFFGKSIHEATGSPVGLIHTSWGGTPAQAWTSIEALDKVEALKKAYGDQFRNMAANLDSLKDKYQKETLPKFDADLKAWQEQDKQNKAQGKPSKPAPRKPMSPDQSPFTGSVLYNGMLAPIIPFAIDGAIWYQGESNAGRAVEYRTLFPTMIADWRARWGQGDFPFYYVQLANFMARKDQPTDSAWAMLREAQTMTLKQPNTGMAVIIDIGQGNDIHPRDKMDVGNRLALWALKNVFGKDVVYSGPLYAGMKVDGSSIRVSFTSTGSGLKIGAAPSTQPSVAAEQPLSELKGFAIAGEDMKWVWAQAKIEGNEVVVSSPAVSKPVAVRYAWADNPECNLYNKENLPASPFRSDDK